MDRDEQFTEFVVGQWQRLLRSAVLLGCSLGEAEDVAQATLVRCHLKWHLVQRAANRDGYVATVLLNVQRARHRTRSSTERPMEVVPDVVTDDEGPEDWADRQASIDAVRRALQGLNSDQREVVMLRYYLQLSERECADALRVAPGAVKSRLSRALTHLRGSVELLSFRADAEGDTP